MSRPLPPRPSLEQCRKQAADLVHAYRAGDPEAVARIQSSLPRPAHAAPPAILAGEFALHDAQWVVAREYGFPSWPKLKLHIEALERDFARRVSAFVEAACSDQLAAARQMLAADSSIVTAGFHSAAVAGEPGIVQALLDRDPDLARRKGGPKDWEPLLYVAWSAFLREPAWNSGLVRVARLLLDHGANPNASFLQEPDGSRATVLYGAAGRYNHARLTRLLLEAGADPNDGESLYHASEFDDPACLALLLEHGADPESVRYCIGRKLDFEDPDGLRAYLDHGADPNGLHPAFGAPLHKAVQNGRSLDILQLLLDYGADVNLRRADGRTPYALARRLGHAALAEFLLRRGADDTLSPADQLLAACTVADEKTVRTLLSTQPDLVQRLSPEERATITAAASFGNSEGVRLMLDAGFPITGRGAGHPTPLHQAAWHARVQTVELLLERGAPLEVVDAVHQSPPLVWAIHGSTCRPGFDADYVAVVERLLAAGARPPERAWGSDAVIEALRRHD